ncbi:MAG TPA: chemotaxis protein, partial [Methylophilus sp.]
NAALVEEAAAAAESLVEQAENLMDIVNKFTLKGDIAHHAPVARRPQASAPTVTSRKPAAPAYKAPAKKLHVTANNPAPKKVAKTGTDDGDWEEF